MPAQTATKATVMVGTDGWALTAHIKRLSETTRSITPIDSPAELAALPALFPGSVLPVPSYIARTDLPTDPIFQWDGAVWSQITGLHHAEYTGPAFTSTAATGVNWGGPAAGLFVADASKTVNNDFVQPDAAGRVKVLLTGEYVFSGVILPTAVPASYSLNIRDVTNNTVLGVSSGVGYSDKEQSVESPNVYLAANTVVEFFFVASNVLTLGSRIRVTKAA